MKKQIFITFLFSLIFFPSLALAHQPRLVKSTPVQVTDPETSKAYYGQLSGKPDVFTITSQKPFALYVNILVPDINGQKKDVTAVLTKNNKQSVAVLGGESSEWKHMWEPFGRDWYWQSSEYKANVEPGEYVVEVFSTNNDSKYSLAIGETENFNFKEIINALNLVPQLKHSFFNESPAGFIFSIFGWSYVLIMFVLAFVFGFLYRLVMKKMAKNTVFGKPRNIGKSDRFVRFVLAILLFVWAITTSWSPLLLFFSGFCLFESLFSWCGFYAAIGKNTCPL